MMSATLDQLSRGEFSLEPEFVGSLIEGAPTTLPVVRNMDTLRPGDMQLTVLFRYECKDPELRAWALEKLNGGGPHERVAAMRALSLVALPEDRQIVWKGLSDPMTEVWSIFALGQLNAKDAIPEIASRLGPTQGIGAASAAPHIYLGSPKDASRLTLIKFGRDSGLTVTQLLRGVDETVIEACKVLQRIPYPECRDSLYFTARRLARRPLPTDEMTRRRHPPALPVVVETLIHYRDPRAGEFLELLAEQGIDLRPKWEEAASSSVSDSRRNQLIAEPGARWSDKAVREFLTSPTTAGTNQVRSILANATEDQWQDVFYAITGMEQFNADEVYKAAAKSSHHSVRVGVIHLILERRQPSTALILLMADHDREIRVEARKYAAILYGTPIIASRHREKIAELGRKGRS
jgi:hypothetical protein